MAAGIIEMSKCLRHELVSTVWKALDGRDFGRMIRLGIIECIFGSNERPNFSGLCLASRRTDQRR